jgi:hypothetical protein
MRYRFQVVCSKYHKGRLKIVYDPTGNPSGTAEYNTAYTAIVDISDTSDFSIDVGWGQREPYRESWAPNATNAVMFNTTALTTVTPTAAVGNGTLAVYVVNELTVPNSTINNDIEINVFVSALEDFEVASPDYNFLESLRVTQAGLVTSPQAAEGGMNEESMKEDSAPVLEQSITKMANSIPLSTDPTNLVYFGERIKSMRQLLKRFCRHKYLPGDAGGAKTIKYTSQAFPYYPGYTSSTPINWTVFALTGGSYAYGYMTFMNYLTSAYGGWRGGIRKMIDMSNVVMSTGANASVYITRAPDGTALNWVQGTVDTANTWIPAGYKNTMDNAAGQSTMDGTVTQALSVNPQIAFEIPYARPYRFSPAKRHSVQSSVDPFDTGFEFYTFSNLGVNNRLQPLEHVAGAEDYTCFFYLGPPIFYLETTIPDT